jgi:Sugar (pentulose and hexulose) kinases
VGFDCSVVLPATHDTASAYLAAPTTDDNAAYISSGTWSLLGEKSIHPVNTPEAMRMGFSNEGAFPSNYKVIKTIIGMYMLEMIRHELPDKYSYDQLISMAIEAEEINSFIDMRNLGYLMTPSVIDAIKDECAQTEQQVPGSLGQVLQVVFRSMAKTYAKVIKDLQQITGRKYSALYIVGGGSQNDYLNLLTAQATGIPVFAGPHEATVIGNLLSQMLISNEFPDLESALKVERESFPIKKFA